MTQSFSLIILIVFDLYKYTLWRCQIWLFDCAVSLRAASLRHFSWRAHHPENLAIHSFCMFLFFCLILSIFYMHSLSLAYFTKLRSSDLFFLYVCLKSKIIQYKSLYQIILFYSWFTTRLSSAPRALKRDIMVSAFLNSLRLLPMCSPKYLTSSGPRLL